MNLKEQIDNILLSEPLLDEIIGIRRHLHQFPELSFEEYKTSAYHQGISGSVGNRIQLSLCGNRDSGPHSRGNIRANALPFVRIWMPCPSLKQTGLAFPVQNTGMMHACGHDVHMTSLLGAIRVLDQLKEHIQGEVLVYISTG